MSGSADGNDPFHTAVTQVPTHYKCETATKSRKMTLVRITYIKD